MKKIRTIIIDDEQAGINKIADIIKEFDIIDLVDTFTEPLKALNSLNNIDLIFLDIQMPKLTGIEFMQAINTKAKVIVTTAYPEYALKGYDYDIIDFVVKPANKIRLLKAVNKVYQAIYPTPQMIVTNNKNDDKIPKMIKVRIDDCEHLLRISEIIYVEAVNKERDNTIAIYTENERHLVYSTLSDFLKRLPNESFIRTHRSFIVNISYISKTDSDYIHFSVRENLIPIGGDFKEDFWKKVEKWS